MVFKPKFRMRSELEASSNSVKNLIGSEEPSSMCSVVPKKRRRLLPSQSSDVERDTLLPGAFEMRGTSRTEVVTSASSVLPPTQSVSVASDMASTLKPATTSVFSVASTASPNPRKRPNFLALKPVNPSLKRVQGGVLPSPETPRVAKSINQMTINGQAYTYLGFKVSTRSTYTCLFKPQPTFIPQDPERKLSMYSNWQPRPRNPNQLNTSISTIDSRVNTRKISSNLVYTSGHSKAVTTLTFSSLPNQQPICSVPCNEPDPRPLSGTSSSNSANLQVSPPLNSASTEEGDSTSNSKRTKFTGSDTSSADESWGRSSSSSGKQYTTSNTSSDAAKFSSVRILEGGFESNEAYTYIRGRGRGRYVCQACGIRCKKPSMLRKHLRTHTDLRPYTCTLCTFSFKTKGNLSKHQKSKSHLKKCAELGIHPESSASLAMTGPEDSSVSDVNSTDDFTSADDTEENVEGMEEEEEINVVDDDDSMDNVVRREETGSFEKEIALSLLALSNATFGNQRAPAHNRDVTGDNSNSSVGSAEAGEAPMDLSVKPTQTRVSEPPPKRVKLAQSPSSGGRPKLHQPWLSPPKQKKVEPVNQAPAAVIPPFATSGMQPSSPPAIRIKPEILSPFIPKVNCLPAPTDGTPNSQFFARLSAINNLKPQAEFKPPSGPVRTEGKAECHVCGKKFARASQLALHMNIHYIERPFRCDPCGISFQTKGHLLKHRRSSSHDGKVYLTEAWGVANQENPRPFKCTDCKIAFRIHGHLAKHLRSKLHINRMECLGKLPFGIYQDMEKCGVNVNEIDTTDCDVFLEALQNVARNIYGEQWRERLTEPPVEELSA